jgi:hypothetical protein
MAGFLVQSSAPPRRSSMQMSTEMNRWAMKTTPPTSRIIELAILIERH